MFFVNKCVNFENYYLYFIKLACSWWVIKVLHFYGRRSLSWRCLWISRSWRSSWIWWVSWANDTTHAGTARDLRWKEKESFWVVKEMESKIKWCENETRIACSNFKQHPSQRSSRRRKESPFQKQNGNNQEVLVHRTSPLYADKIADWWNFLAVKLCYLHDRQRNEIFCCSLFR